MLTAEVETARWFEALLRQRSAPEHAKRAANWVTSELFGALNRLGKTHRGQPGHARPGAPSCSRWSPTARSRARSPSRCSRSCSKPATAPAKIVEERGLKQTSDTGAIDAVIDEILAANADKVAEYQGGKEALFGFFVGQTMKAMEGKANPQVVNELLKKALGWAVSAVDPVADALPCSPDLRRVSLRPQIALASAQTRGERPWRAHSTCCSALIAYLIFFATFLYLVAFVGNLPWVPVTVDRGGALIEPFTAAAIDLALIALFGLQHSVMARPRFKARWTRIVPEPLERSIYVLLASAVLVVMFVFWRPIPMGVWSVEAAWAVYVLWALFGLGWLIVLLSTFLISHFELFGLLQVWQRQRAAPARPSRSSARPSSTSGSAIRSIRASSSPSGRRR